MLEQNKNGVVAAVRGDPTLSLKSLYTLFPELAESSVRVYRLLALKPLNNKEKAKEKKQKKRSGVSRGSKNNVNNNNNKPEEFVFKDELANACRAENDFRLFKLYADLYLEPLRVPTAAVEEVRKAVVAERAEITRHFTPKQHHIYDKMMAEGIVCLLGARKTGKSHMISTGIIDLASKKRLKVEILSAKKENAAFIVSDIYELCEQYELDIIDPMNKSVTKCGFKNGSHVRTHSNTIADTGTFRADILVIDEAQEVMPDVWAKIIPMIAKEGEMRVWIFGTAKAGTPFHNLITDPPPHHITIFEMHMEDAEWVSPEKWKIVEALMADDRMVRQELKLEWVEPEGAYYRAEDIDFAFQAFDPPPLNRIEEFICCIDWGSGGSETVFLVLGYRKGVVYEIDAWSKYNPTNEMLLAQARVFQADYSPLFIMENSALGSFVRRDIENLNYDCIDSGFSTYKDYFFAALELCLNRHLLRLDSHKMRQQLSRYCGDKKKDDWVDTLLHGAKYFFDKYLRRDEEAGAFVLLSE